MTTRSRLNMLLLAVVASAAPLAFSPSPALAGEIAPIEDAEAASGGTCCPAASGSCYLNLDGVIIRESPAYHKASGSAC